MKITISMLIMMKKIVNFDEIDIKSWYFHYLLIIFLLISDSISHFYVHDDFLKVKKFYRKYSLTKPIIK